MRPSDMTDLAVLRERHPHGTRVRYMTGCKCMLCRAANSRYESDRAVARKNGDWNGIVPATMARCHLLKLSRRGIGRRLIAEACGVSQSTLAAIKARRKTNIQARTSPRHFSRHCGCARRWNVGGCQSGVGANQPPLARRIHQGRTRAAPGEQNARPANSERRCDRKNCDARREDTRRSDGRRRYSRKATRAALDRARELSLMASDLSLFAQAILKCALLTGFAPGLLILFAVGGFYGRQKVRRKAEVVCIDQYDHQRALFSRRRRARRSAGEIRALAR